ncbi:unannotated protein [freshwater metagenome]|uniref:Unannotated protein n=1 Tax=freshwater metagenome TaxID=449393 RepID=A0A6J7MJK2_9ZZZZ
MDQRSDAGDEQRHRHRQRIKKDADVDVEVTGGNPLEQGKLVGVFRLSPEPSEHKAGGDKRERNCTRADPPGTWFINALAEKHQQQEPSQGKRRN